MFLHLLAPDRKFFPVLRHLFETAAPGRHVWVVAGAFDQGFELPDGVQHVTSRGEMQEVIAGVAPLEGVVLNGLRFAVAGDLLHALPPSTAVAWYVWGFEAYLQWSGLQKGLLLPQTAEVMRGLQPPTHGVQTARQALRRWVRGDRRAGRRLVGRLDFCVSPFIEEYQLYRRAGLPEETRYHAGLVGTLEDYVDNSAPIESLEEPATSGIQVGNSAWPSNNHVDALSLIAASPGTGTVVVPLGYGEPRYATAVAARGAELLGDRFHPLMGYLQPADYLSVVRSCGHVVMNHMRQQALGNIFAALWRGAHVYMNATTAYGGLARMGFAIDRIPPRGAPLDLSPSSTGMAWRHRGLLVERFARAGVVHDTGDLLDRMSRLTASRRGALAGRGSS